MVVVSCHEALFNCPCDAWLTLCRGFKPTSSRSTSPELPVRPMLLFPSYSSYQRTILRRALRRLGWFESYRSVLVMPSRSMRAMKSLDEG